MSLIDALKAIVPAMQRAAFAATADDASGRLRLLAANAAFAALDGRDPAASEGLLFPSADHASHLVARLLDCVRRREGGRFALDLGGHRVELDLQPVGETAWLGVLGEARLQDAALAQSRLADAVESFSDGFALFDTEDRLVLANRQLLNMAGPNAGLYAAGATYEEILRRMALTGHFKGTPEEVGNYIDERVGRHRALPNLDEVRTGDGRIVRLSETRTADGGTAVVYTDITDLKRIEEVLRKAAEEAVAANQSKSDFLATMSHELRTPLNAIIGFAEIIAQDMLGANAGQRYRAYARDIGASGMHLLDVINQVLDMSKIEAGRFDLHEEPLDMDELAGHVLRLVEPLARDAGLAPRLNIAPGLPRLTADRRAMRQVLLNLLSNAIKFTPAGGRVELGAAIDERGGMTIWVSDTGIGMAAEDIPTALTPFGQVGSPMTRERPGTGLGLPIVKATAELHGGTIAIESAPGAGTTVRVRLPATRVCQVRDAAQTA